MDGDRTAKNLDAGANSATNATDLTDPIHEGAHQATAAGQKTTGQGSSILDSAGAVGKQFTAEGAIGGTAQNVGGPFDKDGVIGKQFTEQGSLGGTAQNLADKNSQS